MVQTFRMSGLVSVMVESRTLQFGMCFTTTLGFKGVLDPTTIVKLTALNFNQIVGSKVQTYLNKPQKYVVVLAFFKYQVYCQHPKSVGLFINTDHDTTPLTS